LSLQCPHCGSNSLYRDGLRYLADGLQTQRWLCRDCGHRFSEKGPLRKNPYGCINNACHSTSSRQVCELLTEESKNLAIVPRQETALREGTTTNSELNGKIINHVLWLKQEGYTESTILGRSQILRYLRNAKVDLMDPNAVRTYIAKQNWTPGRRANVIYAYALFAKWANIEFIIPRINLPQKLPFIPTEREIDDLIAGCSKYVATFLQLCKETGARAGEIGALTWNDIDLEKTTVRVSPEKGSNPRIQKLSPKVIQMLNQLARNHSTIFLGHYKSVINLRGTFDRQRKRMAAKLGNPRLMQIHFHTLRHWKATIEYYKTKDILHVMQLLGHKRIQNTLKYTQLAKFEETDGYVCKIAATKEEISALIEAGFEYVCEYEGSRFFKKPK